MSKPDYDRATLIEYTIEKNIDNGEYLIRGGEETILLFADLMENHLANSDAVIHKADSLHKH